MKNERMARHLSQEALVKLGTQKFAYIRMVGFQNKCFLVPMKALCQKVTTVLTTTLAFAVVYEHDLIVESVD